MIREMTETDLDAVLEMEDSLFFDSWSRNDFLYELKDNPFANLYVLEENNEIIGFYDIQVMFESCDLANIAVKKQYQHQGYGSLLMKDLIERAKSFECENIGLEVRFSNTNAIKLYEKWEFIPINIRKGYYKTIGGYEDGIRMMKGI